ncbi:hypothetical protein CA2015_2777 [Cyclobacterium amurskyense]|uniref:Uncharacterized protein n=1 Tax=Cyclobacterium amurskyense TaxID=320787 RepID=A0A0H4PUY7_9BACT|nr:hypothetical protein CA2015_2777 [Cyclobacterium amurskyense]
MKCKTLQSEFLLSLPRKAIPNFTIVPDIEIKPDRISSYRLSLSSIIQPEICNRPSIT